MNAVESKAKQLRAANSPTISELEKHANMRDDYIKESANLGYKIGDYCAISALPGPDRWYKRSD